MCDHRPYAREHVPEEIRRRPQRLGGKHGIILQHERRLQATLHDVPRSELVL
eukprot:CAMPEP_0174720380 /NCGR_PEP_ID=MMETSP1094-20130205/33424_1 /TAXON_ID=156173 /ORGANISM="Chrysochromulina brevifilum, Strain UTEX LB 985" /LENGTH=51 /DNA_ID=CAMNT_0015920853 /DNA_START=596 /DNA_END=751 /DNA_ORIENTATION=-